MFFPELWKYSGLYASNEKKKKKRREQTNAVIKDHSVRGNGSAIDFFLSRVRRSIDRPMRMTETIKYGNRRVRCSSFLLLSVLSRHSRYEDVIVSPVISERRTRDIPGIFSFCAHPSEQGRGKKKEKKKKKETENMGTTGND